MTTLWEEIGARTRRSVTSVSIERQYTFRGLVGLRRTGREGAAGAGDQSVLNDAAIDRGSAACGAGGRGGEEARRGRGLLFKHGGPELAQPLRGRRGGLRAQRQRGMNSAIDRHTNALQRGLLRGRLRGAGRGKRTPSAEVEAREGNTAAACTNWSRRAVVGRIDDVSLRTPGSLRSAWENEAVVRVRH